MTIRDEHLYHGAALNQIAEHEQFTAINALELRGKVSRSAFKINNTISVYMKYATKPLGAFREYKFTFTKSHLKELREINEIGDDLFLALVCYKDREICCLPYETLGEMIGERRRAAGKKEDQYQLLVTLKPGQAFRAYLNAPGRRKKILGTAKKVRRSNFPNALFS